MRIHALVFIDVLWESPSESAGHPLLRNLFVNELIVR